MSPARVIAAGEQEVVTTLSSCPLLACSAQLEGQEKREQAENSRTADREDGGGTVTVFFSPSPFSYESVMSPSCVLHTHSDNLTALYFSAVQCTAVRCTAQHSTALHCNALHFTILQ